MALFYTLALIYHDLVEESVPSADDWAANSHHNMTAQYGLTNWYSVYMYNYVPK